MIFVSFSLLAEISEAPIDLKRAFILALSKTETANLSEAKLNQVDAKIDQSEANFFPTVNFSLNYAEQEKIASASSNLLKSGFVGRRQTYSKLNFSQSLYAGNRDWLILESAKQDRVVVKQNLSKDNYDLFVTVATNFYSILSLQAELDNLNKTIKIATDRMQEIRNRVKIGKSRNVEVTALEAQLAVVVAQKMGIEGELVTAWDKLTITTGLERNAKLVENTDKLNAPMAIETYLNKIETRSDINALKVQLANFDNKIKIAKAGHFPSLILGGNYYTSRDIGGKNPDWDVALMLTFPLFSGGSVAADTRLVVAQKSESELVLSRKRREAEVEIRAAYNGLISAINQIRALEAAQRFTEQNFKEQEANYRFGQATNLDVISALNSLQDTKRSLDKMRFTALTSSAKLKALTEEIEL